MRLICKIKENDRRGISNHDTKQHSADRLTMDSPNVSKMIMVHHNKQNSLSSLWKLIQSIDMQCWEWHREVSHETCTSGTSGNQSKHKFNSSKSDNKSGKGSSQSKQKNNNSGSTQSNGSTSEQMKSTTPDLSSKLRKDGKLTPQEQQHCLDNQLCLFCGTSRHVAKDCPKSTPASSKAWVSKTDQDKSISSSTDLKKTGHSLRLFTTWGLCWTPLCKNLTLNASILSNPDSLTLSLTYNM